MHFSVIQHTTNPTRSVFLCDSRINSAWTVTCYCSERERTEVLSWRWA